jgi:REP element-mobilizing transposase RayT
MTTQFKRHSIRLPHYDYTQPGAYFITLVTFSRMHLFGEIIDHEFRSSPLGVIAQREWFKTAQLRPSITLFADEFVVMPNHIHGIIHLNDPLCSEGVQRANARTRMTASGITPNNVSPSSLSAVVRAYKSAVTYLAHKVNIDCGEPIWQRNYYENIIRNELDLEHTQNYIRNNPFNWQEDTEYS